MDQRLSKLNDLRDEVVHDREIYLRSDVYETRHTELQRELKQDSILLNTRIDVAFERISTLERWESKVIGIGLAAVTVTTLLGVLVDHLWK